MYFIYALQSLKNKSWLYIGFSTNLKNRLNIHLAGKVKSTKKYLPLRLVYCEIYREKLDATKREYELKRNSQQKEILKQRINNSLG